MKSFGYIVIFSLCFISCSQSPRDDSTEKERIKQDTGAWIRGVAKGDADDYFKFITSDFIFIGQGKPISGKDSIRSFLSASYANYIITMPKWESQEIEITDSLAVHQYTGIVFIQSRKDSSVIQSDRKYLDVLKKDQKGEWKVYLHAFVLNR